MSKYDWLDEILDKYAKYLKTSPQHTYGKGYSEPGWKAKQAIIKEVDKEVRKARIDELENLELGDNGHFHVGQEVDMTIKDRLESLKGDKKLTKESEEE